MQTFPQLGQLFIADRCLQQQLLEKEPHLRLASTNESMEVAAAPRFGYHRERGEGGASQAIRSPRDLFRPFRPSAN